MSITVNGVAISDASIRAEMQHHAAPSPEMAEYSAKLALVAKELMLQEAARLDIRDADEEQRLETLLARAVPAAAPDEEQCQRFFAANQQRFRAGDVFEASHILCAAAPDDRAARAAAQARAQELLNELQQGATFAAVAERASDCPSKQAGGHLGHIQLGQTVPEFEQALQAMDEQQTSAAPLESRFGFHIIHLHKKVLGEALPYSQVREQIAHYLREQMQHQAMSQYLSGLAQRADIQGLELAGLGAA